MPGLPEYLVGLTEISLALGLQELAERDFDLAQILAALGPPPLWAREPGFPTLVHIILEQQVSLASARAAFNRLITAVSPLTPERFLELDDASLKTIGFSRQKTAYSRLLAESILSGDTNLDALGRMEDETARSALLRIKGIGPWTADIYLLMALRRPDIWPSGDLALATAVQKLKRLPNRPSPDQLDEIGRHWQPWRAVAARVLWHYYLNRDRL
jgi:DNA-3-methyladenine glycosylase II